MGDKKTLAKAKMELEELYLGIPDDSVNLTFQDLADVKKKPNSMDPIQETKPPNIQDQPRNPKSRNTPQKLPSLDFSKGLQATNLSNNNHHHHHHDVVDGHHHHNHHHHVYGGDHQGHALGTSSHGMGYDDDVSMMSTASTFPDRGGRPRRPGIPHSNICTICSTYIYIFRHRCLVCGRVYCRNCVSIGMGEMTEGRKCIQCLGKKFSQRYIQRAGKVGCCSRLPSAVKLAELKWAEKGPRRSGERGGAYGHSTMVSRSRSPVTPRTPTRAHTSSSSPPSFVANSPFSPYTPNHHHLPL